MLTDLDLWLGAALPEPVPLAGCSVHRFDAAWLDWHIWAFGLTDILRHFTHRYYDLSTLLAEAADTDPVLYDLAQDKTPTPHRALADNLRDDLSTVVEVLRDDVAEGLDSVATSLVAVADYPARNVVELRRNTNPPADALASDLLLLRTVSRRVGKAAEEIGSRVTATLALLDMMVADEIISAHAAAEIAASLRGDMGSLATETSEGNQ